MHQSLRPVFNFGGKPKITIPCKKFLKKLNFKKVKTLKMIKTLKKLTLFFFRTQSLLIENVMKNKRGHEIITSDSSGCKTSFFMSDILRDM